MNLILRLISVLNLVLELIKVYRNRPRIDHGRDDERVESAFNKPPKI